MAKIWNNLRSKGPRPFITVFVFFTVMFNFVETCAGTENQEPLVRVRLNNVVRIFMHDKASGPYTFFTQDPESSEMLATRLEAYQGGVRIFTDVPDETASWVNLVCKNKEKCEAIVRHRCTYPPHNEFDCRVVWALKSISISPEKSTAAVVRIGTANAGMITTP